MEEQSMSTLLNRRTRNEFPAIFDMFDRFFDSAWPGTVSTPEAALMPLDIYEKDNKVYFQCAVPGIKPEEIEVSVDHNVLTIRGEAKHDWADESVKVYRREFRYGTVARSLRLPEGLDLESVEATFANGMVTVSIAKVEPLKTEPRRITVRPADA